MIGTIRQDAPKACVRNGRCCQTSLLITGTRYTIHVALLTISIECSRSSIAGCIISKADVFRRAATVSWHMGNGPNGVSYAVNVGNRHLRVPW